MRRWSKRRTLDESILRVNLNFMEYFKDNFIVKNFFLCFCCLMILSIGQNTAAQEPLTFKDAQRRTVTFPLGALSFADRVVSRQQGNPPSTGKVAIEPNGVLGVPDYVTGKPTYLSLGNNGSVTIEFTDNYLVDIEGPDLWIFEIGPAVESTKLAISKDGRTWIDIGIIKGSTSGIDIAPFIKRGDRFSFVRVTDNNNGGGEYAGADIDAIGAIGSIKRDDPPNKTTTFPPVPTNTDPNACCNFLRVERNDGSVQVFDLTRGASLTNLSNVRQITPVCKKNSTNGGNQTTNTTNKTPQNEITSGDDFRFVSINGKAFAEATKLCTKSLLECGSERLGYYGVDGIGGPPTDNFREETFTYGRTGVYLLTETGFEDDSVTGERLRLEFEKSGSGWKLVQGGRQFQCARGANAGRWTKEFCQ